MPIMIWYNFIVAMHKEERIHEIFGVFQIWTAVKLEVPF